MEKANHSLLIYYHPQRSWGKVMFLQVCVILFTGGEYLTRYTPPGPGTPPRDQVPPRPGTPPGPGTVHPRWDQVHPPGTRYTPLWDQVHPPGTRYTPQDQVHPPRPGTPPRTRYTPWDQVHPPGQGTPPQTRYTPPGTRYTPPVGPGTPPGWDQVHPPSGTRYTPPDQVPPWDQVPPQTRYTPPDQVPPQTRYTPPGPGTPPRTREIRSTCGRYASYWNAFLLKMEFFLINVQTCVYLILTCNLTYRHTSLNVKRQWAKKDKKVTAQKETGTNVTYKLCHQFLWTNMDSRLLFTVKRLSRINWL